MATEPSSTRTLLVKRVLLLLFVVFQALTPSEAFSSFSSWSSSSAPPRPLSFPSSRNNAELLSNTPMTKGRVRCRLLVMTAIKNESTEYQVEEKKKNKRNSRQGIAQPIVQLHNTTGKVIQTFPSIAEASRQTGISLSFISQAAARKQMQAGGFIWRFEGYNETLLLDEMKEDREKRKSRIKKEMQQKMTGIPQRVVQISKQTGLPIQTFPSIAEAARQTGVRRSGIVNAPQWKI
jgi:hypothetical protein